LQAKLGTYRLEIGFAMNDGDGYMLQATLLDAFGTHIPFKPEDIKWQLPFDFEPLPYSCFQESLCIEFGKPDLATQVIIACARDITCWNKKPKDTRGPYRYVSVGRNHTCAITVDNVIRCWGDNSQGQLGASSSFCTFTSGNCSEAPLDVECPANEVCKFRSVAITPARSIPMARPGAGVKTATMRPANPPGMPARDFPNIGAYPRRIRTAAR